jgi:hypothetical protein
MFKSYRILLVLVFLPFLCSGEIPFLKCHPLDCKSVEDGSDYALTTEHLPRNEPMLLMTRRLNGVPFEEVQEAYTNERGELVSDSGDVFLLPITVDRVAIAEPIECILIPKRQYDNRQKRRPVIAKGSIVARPIEVEDVHGHSLAMQIASPDGMYFSVKAKGFHPREKLLAVVTTDRGEVALRARATKEGTFGATIAPAPVGMKKGSFSFELRTPSAHDLIVSHEWGAAAFSQ